MGPHTFFAQLTTTIIALRGSVTHGTDFFITSIAQIGFVAVGTNVHLTRAAETDGFVANFTRVANRYVTSAANVLCHGGNIVFNRA